MFKKIGKPTTMFIKGKPTNMFMKQVPPKLQSSAREEGNEKAKAKYSLEKE